MKINLITVYRSRSGWRWRIVDQRSGKTIGASTEAYVRRDAALGNLNRITNSTLSIGDSRARTLNWEVEGKS